MHVTLSLPLARGCLEHIESECSFCHPFVHTDSAVHAAGDLVEHVFVDDAIHIEKQYIIDAPAMGVFEVNSFISVSVNSNSNMDMMGHEMWFPVDWYTFSSCKGPIDLMQLLPQSA